MKYQNENTLIIFDFDNTICRSDCCVRIKINGIEKRLNGIEYSKYLATDFNPADELDFSEFDLYPKNAKTIPWTMKKLIEAIEKNQKIMIITSRMNPKPIVDFLKNQNIKATKYTLICCNSMDKKVFYESVIDQHKPPEILLFEDSEKNIYDMIELTRDKSVALTAYLLNNQLIYSDNEDSNGYKIFISK